MADLAPIRKSLKYIAELFKQIEYILDIATTPNNIDRQYNVYHFSIAPLITDTSNYWIAWGGTFDNIVTPGLQIWIYKFFIEVFSIAILELTEESFYVDETNNICYINIAYKPWQYPVEFISMYSNEDSTFGSAPRDTNNLSDTFYGSLNVYPRMSIPSLNNKLNDIISGIITYNSLNITIDNSDGIFDGFDVLDFFNTPMQINKSSEDAEVINDFNRIRLGIISDIDLSFGTMNIEAVDKIYLFNTDFCNKFNDTDYPSIPSENINKNIPVGWGALTKVPLIEVDTNDYIALDPDYITAVTTVYDSDGGSIGFSFDSDTGIITATGGASADVTGKTTNSIGEIITEALTNENLSYVDGIWDVTETNLYLGICADIALYIDSGTTKNLIEEALKSDNAFLIQKNNGLFTIRQWGQTYDTHTIPSWTITKEPNKNFKDATKYFCSSAKILYDKNNESGNYDSIYIDDTRETEIFINYKRSEIAEFETDLILENDAIDLAERLIERFGEVRETITVGLGVDTFGVNLLDTIELDLDVNGRSFSNYYTWIVKEADPGQDMVTLEGLEEGTSLLTFDNQKATINNIFFEIE